MLRTLWWPLWLAVPLFLFFVFRFLLYQGNQNMRHSRILSLLTTTVAAAMLAGCAGMPGSGMGPGSGPGMGQPGMHQPATPPPPQWQTPGPRGGACDAGPAKSAIGKQSTAAVIEKARVSAGAAMARVLHPNQPTTLEFNHERLNLLVDGAGRITAVRCG